MHDGAAEGALVAAPGQHAMHFFAEAQQVELALWTVDADSDVRIAIVVFLAMG